MIDPDTKSGWVPEDEVDDEEEMPLSLRLSIADTLTLGNATCGFMAVYFTTTGILIPHLTGNDESAGMARHSAATAVILMLCAAVFDLFDGLVARKLRSSPMGAELDNLSDLISFGLAPAYFVLVYGMVADDAHQRVAAVGAIVVLLAVVLRLARFSCVTPTNGMFQGMPSPFGALTVVSIVLLELPFFATLLAILGTAWLMVSPWSTRSRGAVWRRPCCRGSSCRWASSAAWAFDAPTRVSSSPDGLRPSAGDGRRDPAVRHGPPGEQLPRQPPRGAPAQLP